MAQQLAMLHFVLHRDLTKLIPGVYKGKNVLPHGWGQSIHIIKINYTDDGVNWKEGAWATYGSNPIKIIPDTWLGMNVYIVIPTGSISKQSCY